MKMVEDDIVYCMRQVVDVELVVVVVVVEVEAYEDCAMKAKERADVRNEMLLEVHVRIDDEKEGRCSSKVIELEQV